MSDGASLHDKRDLFGWTFENHPDGVLVVDSDNGIVAQNRRLSELCETPAITGEGRNPTGPPTATALARLLAPGTSDHGVPGDEVAMEDGRILERRCAPLRGPDGSQIGCVLFFREITSRKAAEANLWVQLDELRRWQDVMLDREWRMVVLKREVNELCARLGDPVRYATHAPDGDGTGNGSLATTSESPRMPDRTDDGGHGEGR
jgi:hypothetical protein